MGKTLRQTNSTTKQIAKSLNPYKVIRERDSTGKQGAGEWNSTNERRAAKLNIMYMRQEHRELKF